MNPDLERRRLLVQGAASTLALGLGASVPWFLSNRALDAAPRAEQKRLVYLFLRGGMDGLNAVIPRGDPNYSPKSRPSLFLAPGETIRLDGSDPRGRGDVSLRSHLELHPALEPLGELYRNGHLAILHRIGYANHNQSHFDSQQFFENGTTDQPNLHEGMLYRQAFEKLDLRGRHFVGFGLSDRQLVALKGRYAIPNAGDLSKFRFEGPDARQAKFLGQAPEGGGEGRGFLGEYATRPDDPGKPYQDEIHHLGVSMAEVMRRLKAMDTSRYAPAAGAEYPKGSLGNAARQAAQLLKETPVQLLGLNLDGWDTHGNQGKLDGAYPSLLRQVASTLQALSRDLGALWKDTVVVTLSEFGRTSEENGSKGTDHGNAIVMFVAGGGIKGGVYNAASPEDWNRDGGVFSSKSGRYLAHRTDFRAVFSEIFTRHFGDDREVLNRVIPRHDDLAAARPAEFAPLGFMA